MILTIILILLCLLAVIPVAFIMLFVYELLWAWASEDHIDEETSNTIEK
jgi:hypothetical protein